MTVHSRMASKFLVIKNNDVMDYLTPTETSILIELVDKINLSKIKDKKNINEYIVVNRDEKYIEDIIDVLRENGHWEWD